MSDRAERLRLAVVSALNSVQGTAHHLPQGTLTVLAERLTQDLTPIACDHADKRLDAHRAEVLAEVTAWLVKKAREFHVSSRKREREQGDTCAVLASKIARGAVRPDNVRMLPDAGFFEVDRTYASGTMKFRCEAIGSSPGTGERRALGWKYARVYAAHHWYATALDPDDWKHGGWTDVTESGDGS